MDLLIRKLLGLPVLASENGKGVDDLIVYIHWLMIALFVGWLAYFVYALWRFRARRHPKADHHGVRGHASNYIELAVAGIEIALLVFVAIPLWAKAVDVTKIQDTKDHNPGRRAAIRLERALCRKGRPVRQAGHETGQFNQRLRHGLFRPESRRRRGSAE